MSRRVLSGALCLVALGVLVYGGTGVLHLWRVMAEVDALEREIHSLRGQTRELARTVDRFRSDPAIIEKIAREELGYVRPGETVLKFPPAAGGR